MRRTLHGLLIVLLCSSPALGWSDAGHKIIASIAWRRLTAAEQGRLIRILRHHPRYAEDFEDKVPAHLEHAALDEWAVQQASVWPDYARSFHGEAAHRYHRPHWHYINLPVYLNELDRPALEGSIHANTSFTPPRHLEDQMNVVQVLRRARASLSSHQTDPATRAVLLAWLIHAAGDVHQPLHATSLYSRELFPHGDRGGNAVRIEQHHELHALWDAFPGGKVQFKTAHDRALVLTATPGMAELGERAAHDLNEETWVLESYKLAVTVVYSAAVIQHLRYLEAVHADQESVPPLALSEQYLSTSGHAAQRRLIQAGYRLGAVLKLALQ